MAWLTQTQIDKMGFASVGTPVFLSEKACFYHCENIRLGNHVRIDDFCILSAGEGGIEIGNYVHLAAYCLLEGDGKIEFADFLGLSARVSIFSSFKHCRAEAIAYLKMPEETLLQKTGDVILKSQSGTGVGSVILPDVTLEFGSGCLTSSVITKPCKTLGVYFGVPARWVKQRKNNILFLEQQLRENTRVMNKLKTLQREIDLSPNNVELINKLGSAFHENGDMDNAAFQYCRAIELSPNYAPAYSNLGLLFKKTKRFEKAKTCLEKAISLRPDVANLYNELASILSEMGQVANAQALIEHALKINPNCLQTHSHFLFTAIHNAANSPSQCLQYAKRFGELAAQAATQKFSHSKKSVQLPLRIGFVSGDFREHPVSYFLESIFEQLSLQRIELFAYSTTSQEDEVTARLKNYFTHWKRIIDLDDKTAATLIYQDGVQILFDLSGHTAKNRLPVFAFKPAPIQISWLGYPATTGLKEMDFYLVDEDWCPQGMMDDLFVEKILRLPVTAGSFAMPENIPDVNTLPYLENGYFTFGSFNHPAKLSTETLDLWCAVLNEISDSKMLLGNVSETSLQARLIDEFKKRGVASERLIFQPRLRMQAYLKLHNQVDMILDTSPYAGGTTTVFAILMGVPVLTFAGETLVSRVGVTILSCAEIEKIFVANSPTQFVELAKNWLKQPQELQKLRLQLREKVKKNAKCNPQHVAQELVILLKTLISNL